MSFIDARLVGAQCIEKNGMMILMQKPPIELLLRGPRREIVVQLVQEETGRNVEE
jgi:hypothetical protein